MNCYSILEQKRVAILFAILLLSTAILAESALRDTKSYDSYWQLKMGEDSVFDNH
jgi:hypothetical protein